MEFTQMNTLLQENFKAKTKDVNYLFETNVDKEVLWNLYLDSFPEGANEIYRERRQYDCSCCRQFVKNIGNIVFIKDGKVSTIWDIKTDDEKFQPVLDVLSNHVKTAGIADVWISKESKIGTLKNHEKLEDGKIIEWDHFYVELPRNLVDSSHSSIPEIKGGLRSTKEVFKRSLEELTQESLLTVLELISQNSLYKGEEWKGVLNEFLKHKKAYGKLQTDAEKDIYAWEKSVEVGGSIGRIRNHSIGALLIDISEDMDLDKAVKRYESIVAPSNYKRPKAIFTKKMLEEAQNKIKELGYMESLSRRFAKLDDITVNNILFSNKDSAKRIAGADVFEEMMGEIAVNPKKFSRTEEVTIENFVNDILPTAQEVEVFLENKHSNNMVSLIAPENNDAKSMFKWDNPFSWAYSGNMTDGLMKERVKAAGGNVEGVLRFSIQWNDEGEHDRNDLDAHCVEPSGHHIYYGNSSNRSTTGQLDVDITNPRQDTPAVENITWTDIKKMQKGTYKFYVHNFAHRGGRNGFKAEIEFDGQIYAFDYNKEVKNNEEVIVAEVEFDGTNFTIKEKLKSNVSVRDVWNLKTNQFVPVSVVMFSPNYWDEQKGIGHKHYFFMLKDCINDENPNGFYNEFLKEDLSKHKRVFEALGGKMAVKEVDDQLSGVGFSSTKRNEIIVKVKGQSERVLKVKI